MRADESSASKHHKSLKQSTADDDADCEELHTAFHVFDANSDGFIDASELRSAMHELTGDTLTDADVTAMIHSADRDGDGLINYEGMFLYFADFVTLPFLRVGGLCEPPIAEAIFVTRPNVLP